MNEEVEYEVWLDDEFVASAVGPKEQAKAEALHYAIVYGQDGGKISFKEIIRKDIEFK